MQARQSLTALSGKQQLMADRTTVGMILTLILALLAIFTANLAAAETNAQRNVVWIDVRTPAEFESGHLPGAYNINFDEIGTGIKRLDLSPETPIALYCKSGRRSGYARQTLHQLGFDDVTNIGSLSDALRATGRKPVAGPELH